MLSRRPLGFIACSAAVRLLLLLVCLKRCGGIAADECADHGHDGDIPAVAPLVADKTICTSSSDCDGPSQHIPISVYVYEDEAFHHRPELEVCDPGGNDRRRQTGKDLGDVWKHGVTDALLEYLYSIRPSCRREENQEDDDDGSCTCCDPAAVTTDNPGEADWFYVPFDVDRSFAVERCGSTHLGRLGKVLDALEDSPHYQRTKGADHVWVIGSWQLTTAGIPTKEDMENFSSRSNYKPTKARIGYFPFRRHIIHHMAVMNYQDRRYHVAGTQLHNDDVHGFSIQTDSRAFPMWWSQGMDHRCTVLVPYRTNPKIDQYYGMSSSFEEWMDRPYLYHFVGVGEDYPYIPGVGQGVRMLIKAWHNTARTFPRDIVFNTEDRMPAGEYAKSLSESKFCVVIRGDDPARSRFFESIAAGCIPLIIGDGFRTHGGVFRKELNYDTFTVSVPEGMFLTNGPSALQYVTTMNRNEMRQLHHNLMEVQPKLIWNAPQSRVAEMVFRDLRNKCQLDKQEMQSYLKLKERNTVS